MYVLDGEQEPCEPEAEPGAADAYERETNANGVSLGFSSTPFN